MNNSMAIEKNQNSGGRWSYQLKTTANSAYSLLKWTKWAEMAKCLAGISKTASTILIFSIAMGADYSFELISIVHWVPQFFIHDKSILDRVY